MKSTIPVYIPNLEFRKDRRESVVAQFSGREEFEVHIVPAIKHSNGAWGLWQTFYQIVSLATEKNTHSLFSAKMTIYSQTTMILNS